MTIKNYRNFVSVDIFLISASSSSTLIYPRTDSISHHYSVSCAALCRMQMTLRRPRFPSCCFCYFCSTCASGNVVYVVPTPPWNDGRRETKEEDDALFCTFSAPLCMTNEGGGHLRPKRGERHYLSFALWKSKARRKGGGDFDLFPLFSRDGVSTSQVVSPTLHAALRCNGGRPDRSGSFGCRIQSMRLLPPSSDSSSLAFSVGGPVMGARVSTKKLQGA